MKHLSRRNARRWTHEVAAWLEYARVTWGIGNKRVWYVGKNLAGGCWIASFVLLQKLRAEGIRAGIVYDAFLGHAWVQTACGWQLDPTFGQFAGVFPFVRASPSITNSRLLMPDHGIPWQALVDTRRIRDPHSPGRNLRIINRILRRMGLNEVSK